jgi:hypothetical protein
MRKNIYMEKVVRGAPKVSEASLSLAGPGYRSRVCLTIRRPETPLQNFLEGFSSVKREQVLALLEESKAHVMANQ